MAMHASFRRLLIGCGLVITVGGVAAFLGLSIANGELASVSDWRSVIGPVAVMGGFFVVGAVLVSHRPSNAIGWLMGALALSLSARTAFEEFAVWAFMRGADTQAHWAALVVRALEPVWLVTLVTLAVLFPTGAVPGRPWRRALTVIWVIACGMLVLSPFGSYVGETVTVPSLFPANGLDGVLFLALQPAFLVLAAALLRIVRLWFRGDAIEREQIKWIAFVLAVTLGLLALAPAFSVTADLAGALVGVGVPVSIAVGVTRYRLFEIDRLISRTVVFAVVALVLGALYAVLAILPFTLMAGLGGGDTPSWVVAGSTLLAAALFSPLRRRVRAAVDRRFNRSRYDAERVIERFSEQVRQSTDLDAITSGVAGAVRGALQPTRMAMWLREAGP